MENLERLSGGACDPMPLTVYGIAKDEPQEIPEYYTGVDALLQGQVYTLTPRCWSRKASDAKTWTSETERDIAYEGIRRTYPSARRVTFVGGKPQSRFSTEQLRKDYEQARIENGGAL